MSPADAARLLELPADASVEQLETRFLELRRKLEDKIARAPTPGLQAKYRDSLAAITTAFETLTLAADSSQLPMLQPAAGAAIAPPPAARTAPAVAAVPGAGGTGPVPVARPPARKRDRGSREFVLVALVALLLLGGGGYYVHRSQVERQRVAAERLAQEQAAAAEQARRTALATTIRTGLAAARVRWEALEAMSQDEERQARDLQSEVRSLRDAPEAKRRELAARATRQDLYASWLKKFLVAHPAKIDRAQAEELLAAGDADAARQAHQSFETRLAEAEERMTHVRREIVEAEATIHLRSEPAGARYTFDDAYGRTFEGTTPSVISDSPLTHVPTFEPDGTPTGQLVKVVDGGPEQVRAVFHRPGWPIPNQFRSISHGGDVHFNTTFPMAELTVTSVPAGVPFEATNDIGWKTTGTTPAQLTEVPPDREITVTLRRTGFEPVSQKTTVKAGEPGRIELTQVASALVVLSTPSGARVSLNDRVVGSTPLQLDTLVPGSYRMLVEAAGFQPLRQMVEIQQQSWDLKYNLDFADLAVQRFTCNQCTGGSNRVTKTCSSCGGRGWHECGRCDEYGRMWTDSFIPEQVRCDLCNGSKRVPCNRYWNDNSYCSGNGRVVVNERCTTCGGDGRLSRLDQGY